MGLEKTSRSNSPLSFLFCGIGDARHLYTSCLQFINVDDRKTFSAIHFTLVDLKPAALARTLIILKLLSEAATLKLDPRDSSTQDASWTIAYLHVTHILPPFVYEKLQQTISCLIRELERGQPKGLRWVFVPDATRLEVLVHLRHWAHPLPDLYRPENMRKLVQYNVQSIEKDRMMSGRGDHDGAPLPDCELDDEIFRKFTVIPPPKDFISRHEPKVGQLLEDHKAKKTSSTRALGRYINQTWKTNPTILDMQWEAKKDRHDAYEPPEEWRKINATEGNPLSTVRHIFGNMAPERLPDGKKGVIELVAMYFKVVGASMRFLIDDSHLRIEMIAGEMTEIMERIRYGCLDHRVPVKRPSLSVLDPSKFPQKFDRIHLSNVP